MDVHTNEIYFRQKDRTIHKETQRCEVGQPYWFKSQHGKKKDLETREVRKNKKSKEIKKIKV